MTIEASSVPIWREETTESGLPTLQLAEALAEVARSPATRRLIREARDRNVHGVLRVPFLEDCRVEPRELGRALRAVIRAALAKAEAGEAFTIDFRPAPDAALVVQATRGSEISEAFAGISGEQG